MSSFCRAPEEVSRIETSSTTVCPRKRTISPSDSLVSTGRSPTSARRYPVTDHILLWPFLRPSTVSTPCPNNLTPCELSNQSLYPIKLRNRSPSASVVPETSTTCTSASACLRSSKNLLPNPFPSCAPGTNPATSSSSIGTDLRPWTQAP